MRRAPGRRAAAAVALLCLVAYATSVTAQAPSYADLVAGLGDTSPAAPKKAAADPAPASAATKFNTGDALLPKARAAAADETATDAKSAGTAGAAASRAGTSAANDLAAARATGTQAGLSSGAAPASPAPAAASPSPAGAPAPPPPPPPPSDPKSIALAGALAAASGGGGSAPARPAGGASVAGVGNTAAPAATATVAGGTGALGTAAPGTLIGAAAARDAGPAAGNLAPAAAGAKGGAPLPGGMSILTKGDADALLELKAAITNMDDLIGWGFKGWQEGASPCAGWTGVTCTVSKRVAGLDLSGWAVKGALPPSMLYLDELKTFNASDCDFGGGLPAAWANWTSIQAIDLSNNAKLGADLPPSWGSGRALPNLDRLLLRNTGVTALPDEWPAKGALAKLTVLDLAGNGVRGSLPPSWGSGGSFPRLRVLNLANNSLGGSLPPEWGWSNATFPSLSVLDLGRNVLAGPLPKQWGPGFQALTELHLQLNKLAGSLPTEWGLPGRFPRLAWLDVYGNKLAGPVPDTWGRRGSGVPRLTTLSLRPGNARLCEKVPLQLRSAAVTAKAEPLGPAPLGPCPAPLAKPEPVAAVAAEPGPEAFALSPSGEPVLIEPAAPAPAPEDDGLFDQWLLPDDDATAADAAAAAPAPADAAASPAGAPVPMQKVRVGDIVVEVPAAGSPGRPLFVPPEIKNSTNATASASGALATPSLPRPAWVQATFNLTGPNIDTGNRTVRRAVDRAMRRALGTDANVTLLALRDVFSDGTVDVTEPALGDDKSVDLEELDPSLAAADRALRAKAAREAREAKENGSGNRRLLQAGANRADPVPQAVGAAGIGNTLLPSAPPPPPKARAAPVPDDAVSDAVRTARAAAAAVAAATGADKAAKYGADGKPVPAPGAPAADAPAPAPEDSPAPVVKNTVQATYLLSTTAADMLSAVGRFNDTALLTSFKKELARLGVRNARVKLADVGAVAPDGSVIPAETLRKPPPPAAVAAAAADGDARRKSSGAAAAGGAIGVLAALAVGGGVAGYVVISRRKQAAAAAAAAKAAPGDGGEGGGAGGPAKGGRLPSGVPDVPPLQVGPGKAMLDAALDKVRSARAADVAARAVAAGAPPPSSTGARRIAPASGPPSTAGSSSSGEPGTRAQQLARPPLRAGSLARTRSGDLALAAPRPGSAPAGRAQQQRILGLGGRPAAGAAQVRRSPSSTALAVAPPPGGHPTLASLTAPGGPLAGLAREMHATEASLRAGPGGLPRSSSGASSLGRSGSGLGRSGSGGEGMSVMLRELKALEAGTRPGSAPRADDATAARAVAAAGSRDGLARAASRGALLRDLERGLGIPPPLDEMGAGFGSARPRSAPAPPPRPDSADGALALNRASALLADMMDSAPRSRMERSASRGDVRRG